MTMNYDQAVALGLDELKRRELAMRDDLNRDQSEYNVIKNAIAHLESEVIAQKETEERQQKQAEHIDGLLQAVFDTGLFEAIEPRPDEGERLHEYEERRREFYLIMNDFVKEQQQALINEHNGEIEQKDDKIRLLNKQSLEVQQELDVTAKRLEEVEDEADEYQREMLRYKQESESKDQEIAQLKATVAEKNQAIQKLTEEKNELARKMEQQKPVEYHKPSESIAERVNILKAKSNLSKTVDEKLAGFYERNKDVLKVPSFVKQEEQPSGASFPEQTEAGTTDELAGTEGAQSNQDDQVTREEFRNSDNDLGTGQALVQESATREGSAGSHEEVPASALEARIEAIEARLSIIERHPNIRISA